MHFGMRLRFAAGVLAAVLLTTSGAAAAQAPAKGSATVTVRVVMFELGFKLSKQTVPRGSKVVFQVVNKGKIPHDFKIAKKKTPIFGAGKSASLTVTFTRRGRYFYLCTVPGHVDGGMFGYLNVK